MDQSGDELSSTVRASAALLRRRVAVEPVWLPVRGGSMHPTLRDGWDVLVTPAARPRRGEVWAFYNPDGVLVVHRCRRSTEGGYLFAGDSYLVADPPAVDEQLIGRVAAVRDARRERTLTWRDGVTWRVSNARRALRSRATRRSDGSGGAQGDEVPFE